MLLRSSSAEVPEGQYAPQLGAWADAFPREQLFVLQYENLTSDNGMAPALRELKRFLSITPHLPSDQLGAFNHAADVFVSGRLPQQQLRRLLRCRGCFCALRSWCGAAACFGAAGRQRR